MGFCCLLQMRAAPRATAHACFYAVLRCERAQNPNETLQRTSLRCRGKGAAVVVSIILKAVMHPVERYTVAGGLVLSGFVAAAAAFLMGNPGPVITAMAVVSTVIMAFNPASRLEYRSEPDGLRIGKTMLRYADMVGARIVRLDGTWIYRGLALPGYWCGKAWSAKLGKFELLGSTGLGQGVLVTMADGRRVVVTPANPVGLVVQLQCSMRMTRDTGRRVSQFRR